MSFETQFSKCIKLEELERDKCRVKRLGQLVIDDSNYENALVLNQSSLHTTSCGRRYSAWHSARQWQE